jgi:hypothetical protein
MTKPQPESVALILGTGFSKCAGLPLQGQFSERLLAPEFSSEIDRAITRVLANFIKDVFGWTEGSTWPTLEDIFTCIDLSASSGHHLGIKYTPKLLRAIRRMAIYRIFSALDEQFEYSEEIRGLLDHCLDGRRTLSGIVVLNWDIVLEKHFSRLTPPIGIDYCCDASDWNSQAPGWDEPPRTRKVQVFKVHGSSNWVYCENCSAIFYDLNEKLSLRSKVGLIKHDFRLFDTKFTGKTFNHYLGINPEDRKCSRCKNMVSSHIATFSYRKSFRTHAFAQIWHRAAEALLKANRWIFVGYSLPKADFELKHMLKIAELRFVHIATMPKRQIEVVTKGEDARSEYEGFFGTDRLRYFGCQLKGYVSQLSAHDV